MSAPNPSTRLLSVSQVAEQLSCSRGHVYNLAAAGHFRLVEIKATGTRSKTRLFANEVDDFIAEHTRVVKPTSTSNVA